ncbi:MAG: cytochrome c oxidase accessory protein CcoG [Sulfurospirillaceae bacterium]|nr:cytochrome c oxidase accessory protein CcoG [Sulfurospirillaceae bacterium]
MACDINSKSPIYKNKRYITFAIITVISLVLPFIRINGNHLFLLNFDQKKLNLFFTSFDMQELYLMPFLLIMLFLSIFFMTTLGGRVWCGWSCPQTIFRTIYRDLIETKLLKLRRSTDNKQKNPKSGQYFKKLIAILLWSVLALIAASDFIWYFVPPETFFQYIQDPMNHTVLYGFLIGVTLFIVYDVIALKENFCIYICPYARVQSVMFDEDTIQPIYSEKRGGKVYDAHGVKLWSKPPGETDECTGCEACVRVCPTHIDIRKGMQLECINCLECADACVPIMEKFGKPSLISWVSANAEEKGIKTKYIRFRTVAYGIALTIAFIGLMLMGSTKEHMLLNINRTSELYKIEDHGKTVENVYTFLFQNTDSKDHKYYFEVENKDISVLRPSDPFLLKAGKKIKKVVILVTNKELVDTDAKDTPVPIRIKAYAIDDKKKIVVFRDTVFFYPRVSELEEHEKGHHNKEEH